MREGGEGGPFQDLGLVPAFDLPDLEQRFLLLQRQEHPDLFIGDLCRQQEAEARFSRIVWAYELLKDPLKRAEYILKDAGFWPIPQDPEVLEELLEMEEQFLEGHLSPEHLHLLSCEALKGLGIALGDGAFQEAGTYYVRWGTLRRLEKRRL
jgi:curved DNA-binding protein CbpA